MPNKGVKVKNIIIGEGLPKICVPMVGETISLLIEEAKFLKNLDFDIVEWRVDFFNEVSDINSVKGALKEIRRLLPDKPLIFTFRSAKEGGQRELNKEAYFSLNKVIAETELVDVIDIELFNDETEIKALIETAHAHNTAVIISNHDFHQTPPKEEIIARLRKAAELGGDLPKIAVMPNSTADVLTLLDATRTIIEDYDAGPVITMSMGGKGLISRLSGELFGSALTFGAAKKVSAPGQIPVEELRRVIQLFHNNL